MVFAYSREINAKTYPIKEDDVCVNETGNTKSLEQREIEQIGKGGYQQIKKQRKER